MIIKSFVAESASAALRRVRKEMGGDAIVLKTRRLADEGQGLRVEVTACLENVSVGKSSDILTTSSRSADSRVSPQTIAHDRVTASHSAAETTGETATNATVTNEEDVLLRIEQKIDRLLLVRHHNVQGTASNDMARLQDADVPPEIINDFVEAIAQQPEAQPVDVLTRIIEPLVSSEFSITVEDRVAVVGMAGSGKSSTLGKLAAKLVANDRITVTLSSLDEQKIAAREEMFSYAAILGVEFKQASHNGGSDDKSAPTAVLIDTPGIGTDASARINLKTCIANTRPTICLAVIPATYRCSDMRDYARKLRELGATHLVATMTDLTSRWGSLLTAARETALPIVLMAAGPGGIGNVENPQARTIAQTLLTREVPRDRA